jgi:putative FmdB family regulatory protein
MYEYRCHKCSYHFEKIQSFSAEPETVCPKCQGELYRPLTAPAFNFKGAGWYVNDYAAKPSSASTTTGEPASAAAPAAATSESAPTSENAPTSAAPASAPATTAATTTSNS